MRALVNPSGNGSKANAPKEFTILDGRGAGSSAEYQEITTSAGGLLGGSDCSTCTHPDKSWILGADFVLPAGKFTTDRFDRGHKADR